MREKLSWVIMVMTGGFGMKLKGKAAIITGAGRGMGRGVAEGYAREGASLVLMAAREKKELDEAAEPLNALGVLADVSKEEDAQMVVRAALQRYRRIDILVNNAGRGMKYVNPSFNRFSKGDHLAKTKEIFSIAHSNSSLEITSGGAKRMILSCVSLHKTPSSFSASQ